MHRFAALDNPADWAPFKRILAEYGSDVPTPGNGIIFAEFDEQNEVVAFQILQRALMAEGLWARDGHANLRRVWHMMIEWMKQNGAHGRDLFVIASTPKIGRACELMGCTKMPWQLYRRQF